MQKYDPASEDTTQSLGLKCQNLLPNTQRSDHNTARQPFAHPACALCFIDNLLPWRSSLSGAQSLCRQVKAASVCKVLLYMQQKQSCSGGDY